MRFFDLHCDTIYECCETGKGLRENDLHVNMEAAKNYEHYVQFFALFCGERPPEGIEGKRCSLLDTPSEMRLERLLNTAGKEFEKNQDWLSLCKCFKDIEDARKEQKAAAFLSIEGAELIPTEKHLETAYKSGVRMVTLSWNHRNKYACGAVTDNDEGLSEAGRELVKKLAETGIIIDVSHLSERGFWDVCGITDAPFIASHSNSKEECRNLRNLSDDQFLEITRRGGLVGINMYAPFLTNENNAELEDVKRHVMHFLELGGENVLALGCDFDGCDKLPNGIKGLGDVYKLKEKLNGIDEDIINSIFYDNAINFIKKLL